MNHNLKEELNKIKSLIDLLDNKFEVLGIKFGLDPIIGLVPGIGDILPGLVSSQLIALAIRYKAPAELILKLIGITLSDILIGLVPVVGDVGDFIFRSHKVCYEMLRRYAEESDQDVKLIE